MADNLNAPLFEKVAPNLLPELKAYLERHRTSWSRCSETPGESGIALSRRHAKIMDGLLTALYPAAFATMKRSVGGPRCSLRPSAAMGVVWSG